jgi:hypothetical protein
VPDVVKILEQKFLVCSLSQDRWIDAALHPSTDPAGQGALLQVRLTSLNSFPGSAFDRWKYVLACGSTFTSILEVVPVQVVLNPVIAARDDPVIFYGSWISALVGDLDADLTIGLSVGADDVDLFRWCPHIFCSHYPAGFVGSGI